MSKDASLREERDLQKAIIDSSYVLITQLKEEITALKAENEKLRREFNQQKGELL